MADYSFKQGEDKKITVSVMKNGSPIELDQCPNVKAILKVNNVEQKKYSVTKESGFGTLKVDSSTKNLLHIFVEREDSKNFPVGMVTVIVLPAFTDAEFDDGIRVEEHKFNVGRVNPGEGYAEVLP